MNVTPSIKVERGQSEGSRDYFLETTVYHSLDERL